MKRILAFMLMLSLLGCSGSNAKPEASTTTSPASTSTTAESIAPTATMAPPTTTTSTTLQDQKAGGESIAITEKVTIVITDPED